MEMKEKKIPSAVSYYVVAAASIFWAMSLPLYEVAHFVSFGIVMLLLFITSWQIWPKKIRVEMKVKKVEDKKAKEEEKKIASTGDPEIDKMIEDKTLALLEMKRLDANIINEKISNQIVHLQDVTDKIVARVVENPSKKKQVRRFFNYYLPTTIKLLNAYDRMDEAGISGINIDGTKGKIEEMMETAVDAYDKQLDYLYKDEALDISTDITVMENLMKSEGLTEK
ncbi:MAG: 5-bromo-4-chloroindolyl phosphate hydrolysis family protein [Lachnospiraceae bacterium]|nr:5-bromo-4-chloroindolyl phosphate hydrolysis family protein [Lachnospiraceae bacterium]